MQKIIQLVTRFIPRETMQRLAHFFLRIVSLFYRGKQYEDPINGITYRKLLPYGRINARQNALAPDSMSLERHRGIWLFLKNHTNFFTEQIRFLHVAPEYCFLRLFKKQKNLNYITGDLSSPWADVKMDIREMPFKNNEFDAAMCNHVFEHVWEDVQSMKEFYRVLKPGGWAIFQVPIRWNTPKTIEDNTITDPVEKEKRFGQRDHVRYYGADYTDRLQEAGFKVNVVDLTEELSEVQLKRYGLLSSEKIIFCQKGEKTAN
ncbi:Methyltransferase domain protein [Salinivirga cyanobacteriivorans]|uniref:Methyltransferase domain protein n=1 Tax=Salinivirga cyanobacteriivorans TaxID=1307839 RepID=A0A0S2I3M0_9BACT|nr:class I SAM-dependent methyltransferase [Salinivirga cyanobacteriivorans]ALO16934.1 Methyltransferase domain protein [Salinivirga cyanobacteriivorans]